MQLIMINLVQENVVSISICFLFGGMYEIPVVAHLGHPVGLLHFIPHLRHAVAGQLAAKPLRLRTLDHGTFGNSRCFHIHQHHQILHSIPDQGSERNHRG